MVRSWRAIFAACRFVGALLAAPAGFGRSKQRPYETASSKDSAPASNHRTGTYSITGSHGQNI
ncbi:MAG: hypothetical protein ACRD2G_11050, partial [Terriglobia bacterium]